MVVERFAELVPDPRPDRGRGPSRASLRRRAVSAASSRSRAPFNGFVVAMCAIARPRARCPVVGVEHESSQSRLRDSFPSGASAMRSAQAMTPRDSPSTVRDGSSVSRAGIASSARCLARALRYASFASRAANATVCA